LTPSASTRRYTISAVEAACESTRFRGAKFSFVTWWSISRRAAFEKVRVKRGSEPIGGAAVEKDDEVLIGRKHRGELGVPGR